MVNHGQDKSGSRIRHEGAERTTPEDRIETRTSMTSPWRSVWANPKIVALCLFANLGALMYGFDNLVLSLSLTMPPFQQQFGRLTDKKGPGGQPMYIIAASWQSLWNAMAQVATAIGAASAGSIQDKVGRRISFLVASLISCAGVAVIFTSETPPIYLAGKIVNGFALGMVLTTGQTYISEITPVQFRGIALSSFTFSMNLGYMIAASVALNRTSIHDKTAYTTLFAAGWVWPGLIILFIAFVPESPYYLVSQGKMDKAYKQLQRLSNASEDIDLAVNRIIAIYEEEKRQRAASEDASFLECFKGTDWRRTRIIVICNGLPQVIGSTFMANAPYFLVQAGMSPTNVSMMIEIGISFGIASSLIIFYFMGVVGFRTLVLWGLVFSTILYTVIGIAGSIPPSSAALWVVGVFLQLTWWIFGPVIGPSMAIAGEVSAARLRAKSLAIGFTFNYCFSTVMNVIMPYLFNQDQLDLGGKIGWIFAIMGIISLVIVFFEVPETKGRSFPELDAMFIGRVPTRKFKTHQPLLHNDFGKDGHSTSLEMENREPQTC